jgi:hypothetical protein
MKLKKLLESTPGFENRKFGDKLPTLSSVQKAYEAKKSLKEEPGMLGQTEEGEFDYEYFEKQLEAVQETIEEFEYEFHQMLDGIAENDEVYGLVRDKAEQAANASRRYINGAAKQLEGIAKLIDRAKTNNDWTP